MAESTGALLTLLTVIATTSESAREPSDVMTVTLNTPACVINVTIITSDGALADSEVVAITVNDINQAPVLSAIGPQSVGEGLNLNFVATGTDPDGTTPTLSATGVPTNATFVDNADGTGTFNFNPDFTQAGVYNVTIITSDGALADSEVVVITVTEVSLPPVLAAIGPQSVDEVLNQVISKTAAGELCDQP